MIQTTKDVEPRVVGFDAHPDSFTAALLSGATAASAVVDKMFNKVPIGHLEEWAKKQLNPQDLCVLEASGNSFQIVRTLKSCGFKAKVLESCHLGKLKEAHANNDKISAVRIGKAYLAGTAREVWVPDLKTQERRDWMHAHRKAVKRTSQVQARLKSYLNDNGVRWSDPDLSEELIRAARPWTTRQWQVIDILLRDLRHAQEQREHWRSLIAQEVLGDPLLLSIVRLCGVREVVAFALGAYIGDIHRFAHPKKLVKYIGLNPAFDDSGEGQWSGGIGGHGNKYLRSLLVEGAQAVMRSPTHPFAKWGRKLLGRKSQVKLVIAAIARKLAVAIWHLMMGRWSALEEIDKPLAIKVGKMIGSVGKKGLQQLGLTRKAYREEVYTRLKTGRVYVMDPDKKLETKPKKSGFTTLAEEYGLR